MVENTAVDLDQAEYNKVFFGEEQEDNTQENNDVAEDQTDDEVSPLDTDSEEAQDDNTVSEEEPQEDSEEEEASDEAPTEEGKLVKLKWNGKEIEVSEEEAISLAQRGFDYTFKTQSLNKFKDKFEAMEKDGITDTDLQILAKVKAGDKEALAYLAKQVGVDTMDLLDITDPKVDVTLRNDASDIVISDTVKPLIEQVSNNPELLNKMQQAERSIPNAVINAMSQDANMFYAVVQEVTDGSFDQVMPQLQARLATMSDMDRTFVSQNPQQFAALYADVKNSLAQKVIPAESVTAPISAVPKPKPNTAEVGIKKSQSTTREAEVMRDAFSDDAEYQRILDRVRSRPY